MEKNTVVTINKIQTEQRQPAFKGVLDGTFTNMMRVLDTNEMINAVVLDVGPMSLPRAYIDATRRNKYAGIETLSRELEGTFINCLSAGVFASMISYFASKWVKPDVEVNSNSWYSKDSLATLKQAWEDGGKNLNDYAKNVFNNLSGIDGNKVNEFKNINWDKVEWIDKERWTKIKWKNPEYKGIENNLKSADGFADTLVKIINDKNITREDKGNVLRIMEVRLTNALGAGRDTTLTIGNNKISDKLENILRDAYNLGNDVYTNNRVKPAAALNKLARINRLKIFGALSASCALGLTNQYINRKITEKRTGKKGFVGDVDYETRDCGVEPPKDKSLMFKKILASVGMIGMVLAVMRVKNWKDFVKKLEFTGPVTSGNAIKTVYAANIVGRFMASDNSTELRESVFRDYNGFLNWLVFGGFAAKGMANLLDKKRENLFNVKKDGKGVKHWLNDLTLKTHNELAAKGTAFAKKNIWKLNLAHAAGITYSALALGIALPVINAEWTKYNAHKLQKTKEHEITA